MPALTDVEEALVDAFIARYLVSTEFDYDLRQDLKEKFLSITSVRNISLGANLCLLIQLQHDAPELDARTQIEAMLTTHFPMITGYVAEDLAFEWHNPASTFTFESPYNCFCTERIGDVGDPIYEHNVGNIAFCIQDRLVSNFHTVCESPPSSQTSVEKNDFYKNVSQQHRSISKVISTVGGQCSDCSRLPYKFQMESGVFDDRLDVAYSTRTLHRQFFEDIFTNSEQKVVRKSERHEE